MPNTLPAHKLSFYTVPKCGCTSIKNFFFEIENGYVFQPYRVNGQRITIHQVHRSIPFERLSTEGEEGYTKIAVVRDPVDRLISCYESKVLGGGHLKSEPVLRFLRKKRLTSEPDLETFVDNLAKYQRASKMILRHSSPLSMYLGSDAAWFDKLFDISEMDEMKAFVEKRVGKTANLPHRNLSKKKVDPSEISDGLRDKIRSMFKEDIAIFGEWIKFTNAKNSQDILVN